MGLLSSAFDAWQSSKADRRNWEHQKEAMQNSHQWEVEDLRKAGLNPILSAGGDGASTGGAGGISSTARSDFNVLGEVNSALDALNRLDTNKQINATTSKIQAETDQSRAQTRYLTAGEKSLLARTALDNVNTAMQTMDYRYWRDSPTAYAARMGRMALPNYGLGALFGGSGDVGRRLGNAIKAWFRNGTPSSNSAKAMDHFRYRDDY